MFKKRPSPAVTMRLGLVSRTLGLLLLSAADPSVWIGKWWTHAIAGFPLGISVPALLASLWAQRHASPRRG